MMQGNIVRCAQCEGRGKVKEETGGITARWVTCPACNGTGKQRI